MANSHDPMRRLAHRFRRVLPVLALFLVPTVTVAQSRLDPRVPKADEAALRTLTQIRDLGVRISLDDFGTGYSSLSYLHRFPISRIKIDKSFVQKLPDDVGSASIVRAIAQLGSSLSMKITAEGIETDSQLSFIKEHGCDEVQGFLTGRPIALADFLVLTGQQAENVEA